MPQLMDPIAAARRAWREQGDGPLARAFHQIACHSQLADTEVDYQEVRREVEAGTFSLPPDPAARSIQRRLREAVAFLML